MNDPKVWWKSKTIWFNILSGVIGTIGSLSGDQAISPHTAQIFGGIVTVGNIILRFFSSQSVTTVSQ